MDFKKPTVQRSATSIDQITGLIMGVRKFGKTTLWADMIMEKFKDPTKGLLVSCGLEHGTNMIDNINTTHINTYKEIMALKKWLIETKGNEHEICMICFDSAEELFTIFEAETIRRSNVESGKMVKSIKAAYGGYTNGEKECAKIVKAFFNELYEAKIMPWAICHTKLKNCKDKASLDEDGYQKLGSALIADYDAVCADCFDIICTGLVDREIESRGSGDSAKRYVKETERRLYFRGNEIVEAGGRLKGLSVPEYIVFDKENMASDFIETVEIALKAGRVDTTTKKSTSKKTAKKPDPIDEEEDDLTAMLRTVVDKAKVKEKVEDEVPFDMESEINDIFEEEETVEDEIVTLDSARLTAIRNAFKSADSSTKAKVKNHLAEYGNKLSAEMKQSDVDAIEEILGLNDEV